MEGFFLCFEEGTRLSKTDKNLGNNHELSFSRKVKNARFQTLKNTNQKATNAMTPANKSLITGHGLTLTPLV